VDVGVGDRVRFSSYPSYFGSGRGLGRLKQAGLPAHYSPHDRYHELSRVVDRGGNRKQGCAQEFRRSSERVGHLHVGRPHDDYVCRSRRQATRQPEGDPMPKLLSFTGRWWLMPASTVSRAIKSSSPRGLLESSIHKYATNTDLRSPRRSPLLVAFVARPESSYITGAN